LSFNIKINRYTNLMFITFCITNLVFIISSTTKLPVFLTLWTVFFNNI